MKYCILIPTINRKDLLVPALEYYTENMPNTEIFVWDNGNQAIPQMQRLETVVVFKNYGVASSWNKLINLAHNRGHENYLILNDDIIYKGGESTLQKLIDSPDKNTFYRCRPAYNWSCYLLRHSIYEKVGPFDEGFEVCYFEDNDYEYRMGLEGVRIKFEDCLNPDVYLNSQSMAADPKLNNFVKNRAYYDTKWGGPPNEEKYKTPFNK